MCIVRQSPHGSTTAWVIAIPASIRTSFLVLFPLVGRGGLLSQQVFQHYFIRLSDAIERCPDQLARELFGRKLISAEDVRQVLTTQGLSSTSKSSILTCSVLRTIARDDSSEPLKNLCGVMRAHPRLKSLASKMTHRLGECTIMH